jgi:hypothetical protein
MRNQAHDAVARRHIRHVGADLGDNTRALVANLHVRPAVEETEGHPHIAEVDTGGMDGYAHLPGGERVRRPRVACDAQALERAGRLHRHVPVRFALLGHERVALVEVLEPRDEQTVAALRKLGLGRGEGGTEHVVRQRAVVGVDQREAIRMLGVGAAQQAGQRRLAQIGALIVGDGERLAGDQHQP